MEIHLNEADIKTAIKRYVADMGIVRPIDNVDFTVKRQNGTSIEAEIVLADPSAEPHTAESRSVRGVTDEVSEEKEPEPAPTEPPFEPDTTEEAKNDATEEGPVAESKSLFS